MALVDMPFFVAHRNTDDKRLASMPTITIRLDDETRTRLKRRPVRSGETLSEFVRAAVVSDLRLRLCTRQRMTHGWGSLRIVPAAATQTARQPTKRGSRKSSARNIVVDAGSIHHISGFADTTSGLVPARFASSCKTAISPALYGM